MRDPWAGARKLADAGGIPEPKAASLNTAGMQSVWAANDSDAATNPYKGAYAGGGAYGGEEYGVGVEGPFPASKPVGVNYQLQQNVRLYDALKQKADEHLGWKKVGAMNSAADALNTITKYDDTITKVSSETGIPKELLQSVLFREQIFYDPGDATDAARVRFGQKSGLNRLHRNFDDASFGLGQIFAKTALYAEEAFQRMANIPENQRVRYSKADMIERLQDPATNIYYTGMSLAVIANELGVDIKNASKDDIKRILARYNGSGDDADNYGDESYHYYDVFKRYNQNTGR